MSSAVVPWQHRLVALSIHLAREAGKVIRFVRDEGFHITNKADEQGNEKWTSGYSGEQKPKFEEMAGADFLTKADTDAQALLVAGYRAALPWLKIVAEEDDQPPPDKPADVSWRFLI